ncbi:MAG: 3-phosphoshikimate 1-carboxyvinyltransferase [bacterium]
MGKIIRAGKKWDREIPIPADKSISHRALLLTSMAEGESLIENFLLSEDCLATAKCLEKLGIIIERTSGTSLKVFGGGLHGFKEPREVLDARNSGTTMRLLCGILSGQDFFTVITGDSSLNRRPMGRVTEPLRRMGARLDGRDGGQFPPLSIRGGSLRGLEYSMDLPSAQVKSAILLASLMAEGETILVEKQTSRDHTERMMKAMGGAISFETDLSGSGRRILVKNGGSLNPACFHVPGDLSSASFFLAAGAILPEARLSMPGIGLNPTRTGFLSILREMGGKIAISNMREAEWEPSGDLQIESSSLRGMDVPSGIVPLLIDEIPILAVAATQARGLTRIRGARELRLKESDRIAAIAGQLQKMGARIEEFPDGLTVEGPVRLKGARLKSFNDHRIAMALAIAALAAEGESLIEDAECTDISFPGFWDILEKGM